VPGIARIGQDTAGGVIVGGLNTRVSVGGTPAAVVGDAVTGHGTDAHAAPVMVLGSFRVAAGGIPVCRAGDTAACGHPATPGSTAASAG